MHLHLCIADSSCTQIQPIEVKGCNSDILLTVLVLAKSFWCWLAGTVSSDITDRCPSTFLPAGLACFARASSMDASSAASLIMLAVGSIPCGFAAIQRSVTRNQSYSEVINDSLSGRAILLSRSFRVSVSGFTWPPAQICRGVICQSHQVQTRLQEYFWYN